MIESFLEEALASTDVRLNHYAPSTLTDQRSMAPTPSVSSSRMLKPATQRDGSMSRVSHLSKAQERSASPQKRRQLPFTSIKKASIKLGSSNMHKR